MTRLRLFAVALGAALLSAAPASPTFGQSPTAAYARLQNLARNMTFVWAKLVRMRCELAVGLAFLGRSHTGRSLRP